MNLSGVDLNLLAALEALLAERSVTRAARRLGLSQPATSHALARLRALLGDPLLVRGSQGMEPTARARELAPRLSEAMTAVREVLAPTPRFDPSTSTRRFSLVTADQGAFVLLPPLLELLWQQAPLIDLDVRTEPFEGAEGALARGQLDLAIGLAEAERPGIHRRPLLSERFVCMMRRGHPALRRRLTLDSYCALAHLVVAPRGRPGGVVDDLLGRLGRTRRVALTVPQFLLAPHIVARSNLVWTAPESTARAHAALLPLVMRPPPFDLEGFTLSLSWHERSHHDAGHRWLREQILACGRR